MSRSRNIVPSGYHSTGIRLWKPFRHPLICKPFGAIRQIGAQWFCRTHKSNFVVADLTGLNGIVKHRLKKLQDRPDLIDGCLAGAGLTLTPEAITDPQPAPPPVRAEQEPVVCFCRISGGLLLRPRGVMSR